MKYQILKAGKLAVKPPFDINIDVKVDEVRDDIPEYLVERLTEKGWIKKVTLKPKKKLDE
jgi:hypothetical protein